MEQLESNTIRIAMNIAFDVDDTLIIPSVVTGDRDIPNYEVIAIYRFFQEQGHHMIIWSGSGVDWATMWGEKLGLKPDEIRIKQISYEGSIPGNIQQPYVDIAFDDCDVNLAKVNVKVKRVANNISRELWNKTKKP